MPWRSRVNVSQEGRDCAKSAVCLEADRGRLLRAAQIMQIKCTAGPDRPRVRERYFNALQGARRTHFCVTRFPDRSAEMLMSHLRNISARTQLPLHPPYRGIISCCRFLDGRVMSSSDEIRWTRQLQVLAPVWGRHLEPPQSQDGLAAREHIKATHTFVKRL